MYAAASGDEESVGPTVRYDVDLDAKDSAGRTTLDFLDSFRSNENIASVSRRSSTFTLLTRVYYGVLIP